MSMDWYFICNYLINKSNMKRVLAAFLLFFVGGLDVGFAQTTLFSVTPKSSNKTLPTTYLAPNISLKRGFAFGGRIVSGATCMEAPSRLFTDSLMGYFRDSILSNVKKTAKISFAVQANNGYKLLLDSITCQFSANLSGVKYRMAFSVDGGTTVNFVDSDYVVPVVVNCAASTIPVQSAVCNYLIQSSQSLVVYCYFFNAPKQTEINIFSAAIKGCVLPVSAAKDCNGKENIWLSPPPLSKYQLLYNEDFSSGTTPSKINTKNWVTRGYGGFGGLMKDTNVYLADGMLHVKYTKLDTNYIGGGIQSLDQFHYGYYETYMKTYVGAANFHQTFWLIGTNNNWKKDSLPVNNTQVEIDALQMDSYISKPSFASYFRATNAFAMYNHAPVPLYADALPYIRETASGNASVYDTGWIKVGMEWLPDSIKLYYNDTLRQLFLIPKPWQHHAQLGVQFSGLPTPHGYSTSMTANMSCPPNAEMLVDWFKFYAPTAAQANMNFISEGGFDNDLRPRNLHRPLCWINAQAYDIQGAAIKLDTIATSIDTVVFHSGRASLKHDHTKPYKTASRQIMNNIANGKYTLSAWVRCSGGQNLCQMRVLTGGSLFSKNIPSTNGSWIQLSQDVTVQNNRAVIEFYSDALARNTLHIDDVFFIRLPQVSLPISFLDVNAKNKGNHIIISWQVAEDKEVLNYELECSEDGVHFQKIATVLAHNRSVYSYEDKKPFNKNINLYYRIKLIAKHDHEQYSNVVQVAQKGSHTNVLQLYPNPDKGVLYVAAPQLIDNQSFDLKMISFSGKVVWQQTGIKPLSNRFTINTSFLISGNYYLVVTNSKGEQYQAVFSKE